MKVASQKILMDDKEISISLKRLAHEIIEKCHDINNVMILGIQTRGVYLAQRVCKLISSITKKIIPMGVLDITLYRDDVDSISNQPVVKETKIPFDIENKNIVLVDDVLFTGRTIRAAIDEIMDFGRPRSIKLAVLIDRGNRELPIQPDIVGKVFPTSRKKEMVRVYLKEIDKKDQVVLYKYEN